jgi:hypothetical protein
LTRLILDPTTRGASGPRVELERVPKAIRDTECYPDLSMLQPGDLLLVSPLEPGWTARMIIGAQRQVHDEENARWMHAALYLGDNMVVEIDGGGVHVRPLFKYVLTHRMLFRRVIDADGQDIDLITGYKIALKALRGFSQRYEFANIFVTAYDCLTLGSKDPPLRAVRSRGSICSDFFNQAVFATIDRPAARLDRNPLQPADLSASKLMRDIPVRWGSLELSGNA